MAYKQKINVTYRRKGCAWKKKIRKGKTKEKCQISRNDWLLYDFFLFNNKNNIINRFVLLLSIVRNQIITIHYVIMNPIFSFINGLEKGTRTIFELMSSVIL